ncbi:MAG: PilZ domain-containing protein [Proteobacteria bacterium]|nr:PilZ domain-containing protein [Pseudomonadota bacterium]
MTPVEVQQLLQDCQYRKVPVFIGSQGIDISFQTLLLENMVRPEYIRKFSNGPKFFLQCKMLRLQTTKVGPHETLMSFFIQENSILEETRQAERFLFAPEERVTAEFTNPHDKTTKIQRPVMDMSASGLSLRINVESKLFLPGTTFSDLKVQIDQKPYSKSPAEVVYSRKFMDINGKLRIQVGLKFTGGEK